MGGEAPTTVGFHNFNLIIFNLRVSNPNKLIVNVFFDTMSDFNVPGSRPKKHDEISEIDTAPAPGGNILRIVTPGLRNKIPA